MKQIKKIKGIEKIKRQNMPKQRSIPLSQRNAQTELYLLNNEKTRVVKELESLQKREEFLQTRLKIINQEMKKLLLITAKDIQQYAIETEYNLYTQDTKQWKTKPMNY
jgi:predicted ribonuclease YlaK